MRLLITLLLISNIANAQKIEKKIIITKDVLYEMSNEMNRRMPMVIDKDTTVETVTYSGTNQLIFNYKLVNTLNKDAINLNLINFLREEVVNKVCSTTIYILMKNGLVVNYTYRSKEGKYVGEIIVRARDCK